MDLYIVLLLFTNVVLLLIDGCNGHPKSWLTTTTRRPKAKPRQRLKPKRLHRPKRSIVNWDVTYYPGLTAEYKDALQFDELERFIKGEGENAPGESGGILSLLKEKQKPPSEEPIEFEFQKRVMIQLKNPRVTQPDKSDIKISKGHPVFEPHLGHKNLRLDLLEGTPKPNHPEVEKHTKLTSGTSEMDDIPEEVIQRLLLDESTAKQDTGRKEPNLQPIFDDRHKLNHQNSRDNNAIFLHRLQENRENRYKFLLKHFHDQQNQIDEEDWKFLKNANQDESNDNESDISDHI